MNRDRRQMLLYSLLGLLPVNARAACRVTEPNGLGPFYRRNAPFRRTLTAADEPGRRLHVSGRVLGSDGCTPLRGAVIDVWHANEAGRYYNVGADGDSTPQEFKLRGRMRTDGDGAYDFLTIVPGTYSGRPKHIHYVVVHPQSKPFVTQLYFEGDPLLERDWLARESLVRPLVKSGDGASTRFDIVLAT